MLNRLEIFLVNVNANFDTVVGRPFIKPSM